MRVVIFCGGFGTRMWPASRKSFPKQFYPLINGKSFFELTYRRFRKIFKPEDIFVSTEERYTKFIKEQTPEIPHSNIISEPERKDNLAAVGLVAALVEKRFPGEVIFFSWADHLIGQEEKFLRAVLAVGNYSKQTGLPVTINEEPNYPSIHNGWIKLGEAIDEFKGYQIRKIEKFVEKPDLATAKKLFTSGNYLLHTGYGAWPSRLLLDYYKQLVPEMYNGLTKIAEAWGTKHYSTVLYREYHKFVKESVDFGLFQKIPEDKRLTISTNVSWEDAGTWELFFKALKEKGAENVLEGEIETELLESEGNLVIGPKGKMVSLIGIRDLVIIDTPDALLVCRMDKTSDVKEVFAKIEEKKPEYVE